MRRNAALKCLISRQYAENIQEERQQRRITLMQPSVNKTFGNAETEKCRHWLDHEDNKEFSKQMLASNPLTTATIFQFWLEG